MGTQEELGLQHFRALHTYTRTHASVLARMLTHSSRARHPPKRTGGSHAQKVWEAITPELYGLFWTLTVHDIYVPTKAYEREMDKVRAWARLHGPKLGTGGQVA